MTTVVRLPYTEAASANLLAHLPLTLSYETHSLITVSGLLDTGSTVSVLPYTVGQQLGLVWEQQTTVVHLTGNLARLPARGIIVSGQIASFSPVKLAFAWTQSTEVPVILGQVNFFMEFDICFFGSQAAFEVKLKSKQS